MTTATAHELAPEIEMQSQQLANQTAPIGSDRFQWKSATTWFATPTERSLMVATAGGNSALQELLATAAGTDLVDDLSEVVDPTVTTEPPLTEDPATIAETVVTEDPVIETEAIVDEDPMRRRFGAVRYRGAPHPQRASTPSGRRRSASGSEIFRRHQALGQERFASL